LIFDIPKQNQTCT